MFGGGGHLGEVIFGAFFGEHGGEFGHCAEFCDGGAEFVGGVRAEATFALERVLKLGEPSVELGCDWLEFGRVGGWIEALVEVFRLDGGEVVGEFLEWVEAAGEGGADEGDEDEEGEGAGGGEGGGEEGELALGGGDRAGDHEVEVLMLALLIAFWIEAGEVLADWGAVAEGAVGEDGGIIGWRRGAADAAGLRM